MGDRLLRLHEVEEITGLGNSTIYRKIGDGTFPRSVRVTPRSVRWRRSDIDEWIESLPVTGEDSEGRETSGVGGERPRTERPKTQRGVRHTVVTSRRISSPPKRRNPGAASPDHLRTAPRPTYRAGAGSGRGARRRPRRIPAPVALSYAGVSPVPDHQWESAWWIIDQKLVARLRLREVVRPSLHQREALREQFGACIGLGHGVS